jgi:hypothetical protein
MNKKSTADRGTAWALRFMLFHAAVKLGRYFTYKLILILIEFVPNAGL